MPVSLLNAAARAPSGLLTFLQAAFDLVFPPSCSGCGRVDTVWCDTCAIGLANVPLRVKTTSMPGGQIAVTGIHAGKLQDAIHALKYDHVTSIAVPLGQRLVAALDTLEWSPDLLIPLPLHRERMIERGYNQSELLARQITAERGIPCLPDAAWRERYTRPQVGLNRDERLQNVMNAFNADSGQCRGRIVLIVDDVLTTGATLSACAAALLEAGAAGVYGLTVAAARDQN
jgi:competence protein ComFC